MKHTQLTINGINGLMGQLWTVSSSSSLYLNNVTVSDTAVSQSAITAKDVAVLNITNSKFSQWTGPVLNCDILFIGFTFLCFIFGCTQQKQTSTGMQIIVQNSLLDLTQSNVCVNLNTINTNDVITLTDVQFQQCGLKVIMNPTIGQTSSVTTNLDISNCQFTQLHNFSSVTLYDDDSAVTSVSQGSTVLRPSIKGSNNQFINNNNSNTNGAIVHLSLWPSSRSVSIQNSWQRLDWSTCTFDSNTFTEAVLLVDYSLRKGQSTSSWHALVVFLYYLYLFFFFFSCIRMCILAADSLWFEITTFENNVGKFGVKSTGEWNSALDGPISSGNIILSQANHDWVANNDFSAQYLGRIEYASVGIENSQLDMSDYALFFTSNLNLSMSEIFISNGTDISQVRQLFFFFHLFPNLYPFF
ncbi:hypothetical protein RFI_22371 [Reticulomyxa filosa]|uniref:Uncharacterized protein n=1 Tax=Reticulomyxa filosa TaxID=46433 RepID=X6MNJ5_RETFI|nr:hypothetical protein RFI_22371 [Reticulomyxa filosa]|eukprot:ETO14997.1 hypothetical protein RFI_22371 [Reticulomyxa filosa]